MEPSVDDQLRGIATVLADVVAPLLDDAYAADVLGGAVATLRLLADGGAEAVPFWRWEVEQTTAVLGRVGVEPPPAPPADADPSALAAHHDAVRAVLEASIPAIRAEPEADRALVALMQERCARYPFAAHGRRGPVADTAR